MVTGVQTCALPICTMQWRLLDCFRQQRLPEMAFLSPASIDLITYMGVKGKDGIMDAPAIKR